MILRGITCKSALSPSRLRGYDYALNPYRGCEHACLYCYAPYVLREKREWGSFVDYRENMPLILSRELKKKRKGVIGLSTVTDPYQPIEKKIELTRNCLKQILKEDFPLSILTKSALLERDIDLIKKLSKREVGITVTAIDDELRRLIEPKASTLEERLNVLTACNESQIPSYVFMGPLIPFLDYLEEDLQILIRGLKKTGIRYLMVDKLNYKMGLKPKIQRFIEENYPEFSKEHQGNPISYFQSKKKEITMICKELGLPVEFLY